jgi:hypothetical protein
MQKHQACRVPVIVAVTAAIVVGYAGLASAQVRSAEGIINGGAETQATSVPIHTVPHYRGTERLLDTLPDKAPNTGDDAFIYGDETAFLSIFWMSYIPIVMVILWLIGDWVRGRFRKLRTSFQSSIAPHTLKEMTHVQR